MGIELTIEGMNETKSAKEEVLSTVVSAEELVLKDSRLSAEEEAAVLNFAEQLDLNDDSLSINYGSQAQEKMNQFSDSTLANVKTQDFGEIGGLISGLILDLEHAQEEPKKGLLGFFKDKKQALEEYKIKFDSASKNVDRAVGELRGHKLKINNDIVTLDGLYVENMRYLREISMYILAGKLALEKARSVTLKELEQRAIETGHEEDALEYNAFAKKCDQFEKKLYDLALTRQISIQMAPQILTIKYNNSEIVQKIDSTIMNTIPLWKNQLIVALGLENSKQAASSLQAASNFTNQLLIRNAQSFHDSSIAIAKESERGIVDISTLKETSKSLISTLKEVAVIQKEGRVMRLGAENEIRQLEEDLKNGLLSLSLDDDVRFNTSKSTELPKSKNPTLMLGK